MKKILFAILFLTMMSIQSVKAQSSIVALHHEGNVTLYSGTQLQEALDVAVEGDTLYLSEGTFPSIDVDNGQVVIGTGEKTIIAGNVTANSKESEKSYNCVLDGLYVTGNISISGGMKGMLITQCTFSNLSHTGTTGLTVECVVARCWAKSSVDLGFFTGLSILNSKIANIKGYAYNNGGAVLTNCNIGKVTTGYNDFFNTYINCIIDNFDSESSTKQVSLLYCYVSGNTSKASLQNCYVSQETILDENLHASANGYLGNDGTEVGITGGDSPYTLTPSSPHVSAHSIEVDAVNQKLNVTLTIEN